MLVHTGWSEHWSTTHYYENHPFLTRGGRGSSAGSRRGAGRHRFPQHRRYRAPGIPARRISVLLREEILIVEHLRGLELLPDRRFRFSAVPPKFKGVGTFPVRAFAQVK